MAFKLPGVFGKVQTIIGKVLDVLIKGRELGLWSKQAGPNIKTRGFVSTSTDLFAIVQSKPQYSAVVSVQKGIKHFLLVAFYALAAGFSAWLLNAPGVEAFLHSANVPTLLIGVLVPILAGLGRAIGNLNKNFNPQEGQE